MKKILFLYNTLADEVTGGQKYERQLMEVLRDSGNYDVGIRILKPISGKYSKLLRPFKNMKLVRILSRHDLIIFNSAEGFYFIPLLFLSRLFHKGNTAVIHHHYLHKEMTGFRRHLYRWMEKRFLRLADHIVTPSPYIRDCDETKDLGRDFLMWMIPFNKKEVADVSPVEGNLVYVGTIEKRKGLIYLIEALRLLKQRDLLPHLTVIGKEIDPEYGRKLRDEIAKEGLDVTFTGFISLEQKEQILRESDIFVFPSLLEGYGMAVNEVRRYGLPVVCFSNSALPYSVSHLQDGILVPDRDASGLADALALLLSDRDLRTSLSKGSAARNGRLFSHEDFKEKVLQEFPRLLTRNKDNPASAK